jgi:hypothetical protein
MLIALTKRSAAKIVANLAVVAVVITGGGLAGCSRIAMTADEFRAQQAGGVETIEVDRPLRDVAATFRDRAPACIQDVQTTSISGPAHRQMMTKWLYRETVIVTDKKVELAVQGIVSGLKLFDEPANGMYVLIAQAVPIDGRRSRIEIYGPTFGWGTLRTAAKGWAAGTFTGCPEMP